MCNNELDMYFFLKNQLPLQDDPEGFSRTHFGVDVLVQ
jgi:hypothetical protein